MGIGGKYCFLGEFEHTLDSQRRVAIPSEWRIKDGDGRFVVLPAKGAWLQMLPFETFDEEILSKARKMSLANNDDMRALAELGSRAQICECDKQGRIQLSPKLVAHAALSDKVSLVGSLYFIRLWTPESRERGLGNEDGYQDVLQRISERPDSLSEAVRGALGGTK